MEYTTKAIVSAQNATRTCAQKRSLLLPKSRELDKSPYGHVLALLTSKILLYSHPFGWLSFPFQGLDKMVAMCYYDHVETIDSYTYAAPASGAFLFSTPIIFMKRTILTSVLLGIVLLTNVALSPATLLAKQKNICEVSFEDDEVIWLARAIFSETKDPGEMYLVAWVIRNRVNTEYLGDTTYKEVVLHKGQFSGLQKSDKQYHTNVNLSYFDTNKSWKDALDIAHEVFYASDSTRPLPQSVKHFYSPQSVRRAPSWADDKKLYHVIEQDNPNHPARFAFYDGVK